jgi:nitrate reductase molybdenum cofactor assembly chaperone
VDRSHYAVLADLFAYPHAEFEEKIERVQAMLDDRFPDAAEELRPFTDVVPKLPLHEAEELFTRSFDVQSLTTLDAGYVLFGDDYKRGELLANLNGEHRRAGLDCGTELGDHMPNLLRLIAKMEDQELMRELVEEILYPALRQMIAEFDPERVTKRDALYRKHHKTLIETRENDALIYGRTLKTLRCVLHHDFELKVRPTTPATHDFLRSVGSEMALERNA